MKNTIREKVFLFLFMLAMLLWQVPKVNAQVNFNGAVQSEDIVVCDDSKPLEVDFTVTQQTNSPIEVRLEFADGIEYAGEQAIQTADFVIQPVNVTNLGAPTFIIKRRNNGSITAGQNIKFTVNRKANCTAYTNAITSDQTGFEFKDKVIITIDGTIKEQESAVYNVKYPNFILTAPSAINNADIGQNIERTFTLQNGGFTSARRAYVTIDYGSPAYFQGQGQPVLQVSTGGNFVDLTPFSTNGGVVTYVLQGNVLGANGELANGQTLTFKEKFKLKTCNLQTKYAIGWGCDPASLCQVQNKTSTVTMKPGAANFNGITFEREGFTNICSPYKLKLKYKNSGTGGTMGGMYDVVLEFIGADFNAKSHLFSNYNVNGVSLNNVYTGPYNGISVETKNNPNLNTDPDGPGVGLDDLDGDGYYDDLPVGATVELEITVKLDDSTVACNQYIADKYNTGVAYHTPCDSEIVQLIINQDLLQYQRIDFADNSYAPANIEAGVPFQGRLGYSYFHHNNDYSSDKTRYVVEIEVPVGMSLTNIKWVKGLYPEVDTPQDIANYSENIVGGKKHIKFTSPTADQGYVTFDAVYNCQANNNDVRMSYKFHEVADYENAPTCYSLGANLSCAERIFTVVGCAVDCPTGGPTSTILPVVEREDNSLGWTDATMTTLQSRSNISKYDLAKSMYKDEFRVYTKAVQNGSASNLGARLALKKDTKGNNGLETLTADVIIRRGGNIVGQASNITAATHNYSTSEFQIIDWDFKQALPNGGLIQGDEIEVTTRYRVISEFYPQVDDNAGKEWYLYNSDSPSNTPVWEGANKRFCLKLTPEIYLMGSSIANATNSWVMEACQPIDLGGNVSFLARRFAAGALKYADEYRPGMKIDKFYLEVPKGVTINQAYYHRTDPWNPPYTAISHESRQDLGDKWLYTYKIPENYSHFNTTVTNGYGFLFRINVTANCLMSDNASAYDKIKTYLDITDYYYYSAKQTTVPAELIKTSVIDNERQVRYTKKPSIQMINQSGEVSLTGQAGSWTVRFNNPSQSTAPYNWIALPDTPGLVITKVTRLSDNAVITPTTYAGGKMYKLKNTGVDSGGYEDYKIEFKYTNCTPVQLKAQGGWNCSGYPSTPDEYICDAKEVLLKATPLATQVEVVQVQVPATNPKPELCTDLEYVYQIQSSGAANLYDPIFKIVPTSGLSLVNNEVQVEYPAGSNNWQTFTATQDATGTYYINTMQHTVLAGIGYLKGVSESNNNASRQVNVKFKLNTSCDFVSGKGFKVKAEAKNACGVLSEGSDDPEASPAIQIEGADAPYLLLTDLSWTNGNPTGDACKVAKTIRVKETVSAGNNITTGNTGYFEFIIPQGFEYVQGSLTGITNGPDASTINTTTSATGEQVLTMSVPSGLGDGAVIEYTIDVVEANNGANCGEFTLEFNAIDVIANLSCGTQVCSNLKVITGSGELKFTFEKPMLEMNATSASSTYNNGENISVDFTIENTGNVALATGTTVTLFDDKDGNGEYNTGDAIVGTVNTTSEVASGASYTGTLSADGVNVSDLCKLILTVLPTDGCYCSITSSDVVITSSDKLAGNDLDACKDEPIQIGNALSGYISYVWSSTDTNAMSYLSSSTIAQPNFTYTGPDVTTPVTYTYTLTVERPGGCTVTDEVIVTVNECACFKDPNTTGGAGLPTNHGITTLQRAGADNGNWPMVRKGAWTALESKTKGFVITRVPGVAQDTPGNPGQVTSIANPKEGMMVYDIVNKCLKIYNGTKWSCFTKPGCPQ